jgi:cobalt-precorrin-5B (C1)-methyltransferase
MRDPVSGFEYPDIWVRMCMEPGLLPQVASGHAVLTADGTVLRRGFTTGTTAAAVCKAAILSLMHPLERVSVTTPCGVIAEVPVTIFSPGSAGCHKYAGDYPDDATAGILVLATAIPGPAGIRISAGKGIGRFSRDTPRYKMGEPAISASAMESIISSVEEALAITGEPGVSLDLSVPDGEKTGARTLNPRLGIQGGISILGTTGLVEPWDDHLEDSVLRRVSASKKVVLTTGRKGLGYARIYFPGHESVLVGSNIGAALACASGEVVLFGLPGLITRFICPDILDGTPCATVEELMYQPEYAIRIRDAMQLYLSRYPLVRVVLINRDGVVTHDTCATTGRLS